MPKRAFRDKVKKTITAKLPRVLVGPFEVCVKVPAEGRLGRDSAMNCDFLMEFTVPSGPGDPAANLSRALADLARFYAGVTDDMGGTAEIIILRRRG